MHVQTTIRRKSVMQGGHRNKLNNHNYKLLSSSLPRRKRIYHNWKAQESDYAVISVTWWMAMIITWEGGNLVPTVKPLSLL